MKRYLLLSIGIMACSVFNPVMAKPLVKSAPLWLTELGIRQVALLSDGHYFGLPQTVWGFTEQQGFTQLLRQLEKNPQPFQQIEVWAGQVLLSGEWLSQQAVLWIKRHTENQFSGTYQWAPQYDQSPPAPPFHY